MRYVKGQKATTRQQILDTASRSFRRDGVSAAGIAGIMSEAGLTNGAFYTHFESKEQLVRDALVEALGDQQQRLEQHLQAGLGLEGVIRSYLNREHLEAPEGGCPSSALLPEIARQPTPTREAYEKGLSDYVSLLATLLPDAGSAKARRRATAMFALMVGTLEFARAVPDAANADDILEGGVESALLLAGAQTG